MCSSPQQSLVSDAQLVVDQEGDGAVFVNLCDRPSLLPKRVCRYRTRRQSKNQSPHQKLLLSSRAFLLTSSGPKETVTIAIADAVSS
jgi:hypothetical protein